MAKIPIISAQKKPAIPIAKELSKTVDRFRPPGGKPPRSFTSSYNKQGDK